MNDGHVMRNIYGGGNIASVGKGNYAGGTDDYYPAGYGETLDNVDNAELWTPSNNFNPDEAISESNIPTTMADYFLSSGKTTVKVLGGTVGYVDPANPHNSIKNYLPYGNVIGGSAGESAPNIAEYPRYLYSPAFFSGYVNETDVTIGKTSSDFTGATAATDYAAYVATGAPKILGSVYGGGQDGHVRRDTKVTVNNGEIGLAYDETNQSLLKTTDVNNDQWLFRGNVYGGGSGVTKYKYDFDGDGKTTTNDGSITYGDSSVKEEDYSNSSGSVTRFTEVNILGGTIYRNVYGGGSMGSVGAPKINQLYDPYKKGDTAEGHGVGKQSMNTVTIGGGAGKVTIGTQAGFTAGYGGSVFGAGRGETGLDEETFGTSIWTKVLIKDGANIKGNVFGGGDAGKVKNNRLLNHNGLVLRYEGLHDDPTDEVGNGTDAEDYHVGSGLAVKAEEGEVGSLSSSPVKELTRAKVDTHGTNTSSHSTQTNDGADGRLREHVTDGREEVSAPSLVSSTKETDEDGRPPSTIGAEGLCKESEDGEAGEDQHGTHTAQIGVHALLLNEVSRQIATTDGDDGNDSIERQDEQNTHR